MAAAHKISFGSAVLMNINMMIGAGIFLLPTLMAEKAGNASFIGWPLICVLFLPIVINIAKATQIFPGEGGFFTYCQQTMGNQAAFICGWIYFLGYTGLVSLQMFGLRFELCKIFPISPMTFNVFYICFLTILALMQLKVIERVQSSLTLLKLVPLLLVVLFFVFYWNPSFSFVGTSTRSISYTIPLALFGFWGFEGCCNIAHLIKGGHKAASKAILVGFFVTSIIYTLFHFGILHIMGADNLAQYGVSSFVNYLGLSPKLLTALSAFISASIIVAYMSATFGVFIASTANLYSMAKKNLLLGSKAIVKTNRYDRPVKAILMKSFMVFLFTWLIPNEFSLNAISNLGVLATFILVFAALYIVYKKKNDLPSLMLLLLALGSWFILVFYSWNILGTSFASRLNATMPLLIATSVGLIMFQIKKIKERKHAI
jgi:amino acid transporter